MNVNEPAIASPLSERQRKKQQNGVRNQNATATMGNMNLAAIGRCGKQQSAVISIKHQIKVFITISDALFVLGSAVSISC
jgi:hypothetical protein